jgi:competence protein ComEA
MNLRLPIVAAVVAVAAGAALLRAGHRPAPPASFESAHTIRDVSARDTGDRRRSAGRPPIVVYVAGDVTHAGLYTLQPGARAVDAIHAAGGPGQGADLVTVNLAQSLSDGDEIAVPSLADASEPSRISHRRTAHHKQRRKHGRKRRHATSIGTASSDAGSDGLTDGAGKDAPTSVVDVNTADESELETLPGVGATLAQRIVAFREQSGAFASPDDLLDVAGVTQSKLDAIEPYVTTGSASGSP